MMTTTSPFALQVSDVTKRYGQRSALKGVNIAVEGGEFVALLGLNGAGKTTLFQLLSGLFVADSGSIAIQGIDIGQRPVAALAKLGIVFQQPTLDLDLSVAANLRFHSKLHGLDGQLARQRVDEGLRRFGLFERQRDHARTLSGGNRRRVELIRALLHKPSLLLMDEPTVGLDPASRQELVTTVLNLRREGVSTLWATHLVDEAELADRVVVLHLGEVLWDGPPMELAQRSSKGELSEAFLQLTRAYNTAVDSAQRSATASTAEEE